MIRLLAILLGAMVTGLAHADSTGFVDDRLQNRLGIGCTLEALLDLGEFGQNQGQLIYMPMRPGQGALIEPFLGIHHLRRTEDGYDGQTEWVDYRTYTLGIGLFTVKRSRNVNWMLGGRLRKDWYRTDSNEGYMDGKTVANELTIGPALGAEYSFPGGFSLGVETGLQFGQLTTSPGDQTTTVQRTHTSILLRYYFRK